MVVVLVLDVVVVLVLAVFLVVVLVLVVFFLSSISMLLVVLQSQASGDILQYSNKCCLESIEAFSGGKY